MVTFSLSQYLDNASGKSQQKAFEEILAGTSKSLAEAEFLKHMLLLEISTTRDVFSRGKKVKKNPWCGAVKEFTKMYHGSDPFYDRLQEDFAGAGRERHALVLRGCCWVRCCPTGGQPKCHVNLSFGLSHGAKGFFHCSPDDSTLHDSGSSSDWLML